MIKLFTTFIALLLLFGNSALAAQCTCPSVKAEGKGNTSCSASESGNWCTVDFNLFSPDIEQRAAAIVSTQLSGKVILQSPNMPAIRQLEEAGKLNSDQLVPLIATYMIVGAVNQLIDQPTTISEQAIKSAVKSLDSRDVKSYVVEAFSNTAMDWYRKPGSGGFSTSLVRRQKDFTLSPGCIEYRVSGLWMMFKASWAAARNLRQCNK